MKHPLVKYLTMLAAAYAVSYLWFDWVGPWLAGLFQ